VPSFKAQSRATVTELSDWVINKLSLEQSIVADNNKYVIVNGFGLVGQTII
jgi:hypothetical protein